MKAEDFLNQGVTPAKEGLPSKGMSAEAFLNMPIGEPIEEPAAAPAPTMLERGKEVVTDFFRPSFAPEPTVPAGMEGMPESAIPAGMPENIDVRRTEISERLGRINAEAKTDTIDGLQAQLEKLSSQAIDGVLPPDLYEQYTALRPQYEQAIEDYNARIAEAQGLTGELEDLKQMEYGTAMTRPISTITGEPVPTPEERMPGGITEPGKYDFMDRAREIKEEGVVPFIGFVSGGKEIKDIAGVSVTAYKLKQGDVITPEERADLLEFVEKANRDTTFGYKVINTVAAMPAFMQEFLATGPVYRGVQKVTKEGMTRGIKHYLGKSGSKLLERDLGKVGMGVAAGVAGATMQAPIMGAMRLISGTIERSMPKLKLGRDEEGNINAVIAGEGEELLIAATKSLGDQWAETVSEHGGGFFNMLGRSAKNAAVRAGLFSATMKVNPGMSPNKVNSLFRQVGYHGVINEMMEEELGRELRAVLGVQEYKIPTAEQLAVELVSFSVPGVIQALGARAFEKRGAPSEIPPAAPGLSETQRELAKEVIREKMAGRPPVPAIPEKPIPFVPPGMPPPVGPPPAGPVPGALPPGQGFGLVEPAPEVKLRPGPRPRKEPEYPEGAEYVAGRPAPEELVVEHKPILSTRGLPWKEEGNALSALRSREDVSPATHKVVKVKKGYGIVPFADKRARIEAEAKPEKVKGKTLIAFVRAMGGIKDVTLPGEIRALSPKETGVVGLTTSVPGKGLGFDEMAAAAVEHGWLPENLEDQPGAFNELLRDDIFAQKEKRPRAERLADIAEKTERKERWKEFEQAEDAELEYFAKHPDEEIDADLDEWQRETIAEIRRRNEVDRARKIEKDIASKVEAENPDLEGLKKDEGFPEYIEGWDEKDLLDEEALAELEAWRTGEEKLVKPEEEILPGVPEKKAEPPMSPELRELHDHKARVLGFEKAGGSFVEGYLKKLAKVAEKTDMPAATAAYEALSEYKKGNIEQASLEAEKILGKLHKAEVALKVEEKPVVEVSVREPWEMTQDEILAIVNDPINKTLKDRLANVQWALGVTSRGKQPDKKLILSAKRQKIKALEKQIAEKESRHKISIQEALKSGKLTPEKYAELHEKDYGPLAEFMPEVVEKPEPEIEKFEEIYRGEGGPSVKEGRYWSPDKEWAAQFTQTGRLSEVKSGRIKSSDIYEASPLTEATDPDAIDDATEVAKGKGFKAVRLDEGMGEPDSVYVFDRSALKPEVVEKPKPEVATVEEKLPSTMTRNELLHEFVRLDSMFRKGGLPKEKFDLLDERMTEVRKVGYSRFDIKSMDDEVQSIKPVRDLGAIQRDIKNVIQRMDKLRASKKAPFEGSTRATSSTFQARMGNLAKSLDDYREEERRAKAKKEPISETKSRLLANIKAEKGSSELINDLSRLGADAMRRGHMTYKAFTAEMKTMLGSAWAKIKHLMQKAYFAAKKILKSERGAVEIGKPKPKPKPEIGREVIDKEGTTVDWDKSKVITKEKVTRTCYATYNKDGSFKKWRTREAINKIKALKKAEVKYKERLGKAKEKFDVRVEKIKTAKEILERRREKIKAIKDYFLLSDSDLRKITRKDIRLMSNFEFKQFIDDIRVKAERFAERRQALNELELLRKEKAFIAENNIRIFHKLPTIKKMTTEQLTTYAEILSGYEKGDQFLTPKRVKGLESTPWSGSKTMREVLEKASKEFDVPLSELKGIRVDEIDRFRYDTSLARRNPFYNFMIDTINTAAIRNQFKYFKEREKLYRLAKAALKSRKRGIIGRLVPRQKELMKYMEAEGDAKLVAAAELTTEEMALADAIEDFYRRAYNWLLINQELKSSRFIDSKYVFHSKRPLSELLIDLKDTGIRSAVKDLLNRWRLDEAQFKILDSKTGEILRMKKFFRQTLYRTGELTPTKNVIKATDIYMQQFFKKMALDESVPAIETLVMALRPKEKTPTGIFLNDSLMTFVKEYLNSKKGRALNIGIQQGGKIDTVIRFVNQIISLRYIALNIPLELAAIVGETTAKLPALGNRKLILANMRRHTPRGRRILEKYKAFTGEGPFEEVLQPARNIGENINILLYGLFKWSRKVTKQDILLGNMTREEFLAETIDPKKLAEVTKMAGRWLDIEGSKSVLGTTSTGAAITKFKGWAIPIVSSTMHDATALARTLTRLGDPKKRLNRQQFQELYRIAEMGAILLAVMSLDIDDDDKDTFAGRLKYYAIRELGTLYNALSVRTILSFGVTVAFLEKLSQNLYLLMTLEKYKTRDELKGVAALKKQLTPAAISQFKGKKKPEPKVKKGRLKGGLTGGRLESRLK